MIPKVIHCVWLSGEEKPALYQSCLNSWKKHMPDYEIREWSLKNLPIEVLNYPFVTAAIDARKWAFATDYIRVWVLYNYGGIYLDLDVEVFKPFDSFLRHRAFTCTEFNPIQFYNEIKYLNKDGYVVKGLNIEAAIMGAEKGHPWIRDIVKYYDTLTFKQDLDSMFKVIMPRMVSQVSLKYGFRYFPLYQILDEDVHVYPPDTFSFLFDSNRIRNNYESLKQNPVRYARHIVAHGWYESHPKETLIFKIKKIILKIAGKKIAAQIHNYKYRKLIKV